MRRGRVVRRRIVCSSSSDDGGVTPNPPRRSVRVGVRVHPDYVGRRVSVAGNYFQLGENITFGGRVGRWGRYKSSTGDDSYGYYIHYDEGDKWWMLESDVHKYLLP